MNNRKLLSLGQLKLRNNIFRIPRNTLELLWLSDDDPSCHAIGMEIKITVDFEGDDFIKILQNTCDPSTIFTNLPITRPNRFNEINKLDYYPSYINLTPEQRWIYLNWLGDVTSEIDIGYVFLYYYGLERHLIVGKFEEAFQEILRLRKYHDNESFLSYSKSALVFSCIYHKNIDLLEDKIEELGLSSSDNIYLHLKNRISEDLSAEDLLNIADKVGFERDIYIKKNSSLFLNRIKEILFDRYSGPLLPFSGKYNFNKLPKDQEITFANISFPGKIRIPELQNYFLHRPFTDEVFNILFSAHEKMKTVSRNKNKKRRRVK